MVTIETRFPGASLRTRPELGGVWAELFAPSDGRPGTPVLEWTWGETAREALAEMHERLTMGDESTPCRLCAGPSVVTLVDALVMYSGHPAQGRVLSRGAVLCRVCHNNSCAVADLDRGGF